MTRKLTWIVLSASLFQGTLARAQGPGWYPPGPMPYANPAPYGYPYAPAPYGAPMNPGYNPGMAPPAYPYWNANYGDVPQPYGMSPGLAQFPPPPMPMLPPGDNSANQPFPPAPMPMQPKMPFPPAPMPMQPKMPFPPAPTPLPNQNKPPSRSEPYMVLPPADEPAGPGLSAPEFCRGPAVAPLAYEGPGPVAAPPPEPYVIHEGVHSEAEARSDCTHVWFQANYLHWWLRRDIVPPLVTTGNPNAPGPGTLDNPDTAIVLGNGPIGTAEFSGVQATLGFWCDDDHILAVEMTGLWLGTQTRRATVASDLGGNPLLAQPLIFTAGNFLLPVVPGAESALAFAAPGALAGQFTATSIVEFYGVELNLANNLMRCDGWTIDVLGGFRYLYLNDFLGLDQGITILPKGFETFNGGPLTGLPTGSTLAIQDSFNVNNRFYGGQIGARVNWMCGCFDIGTVLKLAVGTTQHTVTINGSTTLDGVSTLPGGILAQPSNSGRFTLSDISVVPEFNVTIGYQITSHIRLIAGYTLLGWTQVMRAGDQIDRHVDPVQAPILTFPGPVMPGTAPTFPAVRTLFTAQGLNLGMEFRY